MTKKKASFPDPEYQPRVPDTCCYFLNKKLNPHLLSDVQVELTPTSSGVAARVESKSDSTFAVLFFDIAKFDNLLTPPVVVDARQPARRHLVRLCARTTTSFTIKTLTKQALKKVKVKVAAGSTQAALGPHLYRG